MPRPSERLPDETDPCAIARTLSVLHDRWSFLILRELGFGRSRFAELQAALGIPSDVLSARLARLVQFGVLEKTPYREPGRRTRSEYRLTEAGRELEVVLGALQQWGDRHLPYREGPTVERRARATGDALNVGFVDDDGHEHELEDVAFVRTPAYPSGD